MSGVKHVLKKMKSEKGAALIWALLVFTIVSITVMSVLMIQSADAKEIQFLENRLTAYYASVGGMEFGLAALRSAYGGTSATLLDWCVDNYSTILDDDLKDGKDRHFKPYTYLYNDNSVKVAEVKISIYGKNLLSTDWIVVEAVGKDINSGVISTNYLRINKNDLHEIHRDGKDLPK